MNQWIKQRTWPTLAAEEQISLTAVGDVMWIRSGWRHALSPGVKAILSQADCTAANLETPVDPASKVPKWVYETLHYYAPTDYLANWQDLQSNAQHIFSICNNHALDQGEKGLEATRNIVILRLLQGIFGATLVPLSQTVLLDTYPTEKQGSAMAIWGMGVMIGLIIGQSLGGWLTEYYNWRYCRPLCKG